MNKQRKTSHILNVFQYDADGHVILPASLTLSIAPTGEDNSGKVPTTAWVRSIVGGAVTAYAPTSRTITINGTSYDLSSNRSWSIDTGVLTATAGSGISVSTVSGNLNIVNTGLLTATAGAGISVSTVSQNLNIVNTGLLTATAGSGITVSVVGQNLNVVNTGILTATAGSGISLSVVGQNLNVVNTGILTATAGAGISVSVVNGNLNVVNTITNNNQLTNGAGYITSSALTGYATETYVGTAISNLVDAAPGTLDTLNELAAALGDDPNFATTVSTSIGTRVPQSRTLTINGISFDLSANRSWTINSMIYPSAGIALSTGTAWGTSITDNSANWNTAYGWGNHASAGYLTTASAASTYVSLTGSYANPSWITSLAYSKITGVPAFLTSYTETDTLASVTGRGASTSATISAANFQNAYQVLSLNNIKVPGLYNYDGGISGTQPLGTEWYNVRTIEVGASARYSQFVMPYSATRIFYRISTDAGFQPYVELYHSGNLTNLNQLTNGPGYITGITSSQVTTALGFTPYNSTNPNGYISSYTETSTLANVTSRGATTSTETTYYGGLRTRKSQTAGNYTTAALWTESYDNTATGIAFHISGVKGTFLEMRTNQVLYWDGNTVYHSGNLTNLNQLSNGPGYITSYTETDTLSSVTGRGNTTGSNVITSAGMYANIFYDYYDNGYYFQGRGISRMYGVAIRGDNSSTSSENQIFFWGAGNTTTSAIGFKANGGSFTNPTGFGDGYNTYLTMDSDGRGWVFRRGVGGTDFSSAYTAGWILNNGIWQANSQMRSPVFKFTNSSNNAYLTGNSDWGFRAVNDNGYIQFGPANSSWAHIYSSLSFYFNQNLYVNGTQVVLNSGSWSITATGNVYARGQSNWNDSTVIGNVIGLLSWKNYGNGHVIFDASQGTSPSGGGVSQTNATYAWTASYPTLMGWNGSNTYGVRVDSARVSDNTSGNSATTSQRSYDYLYASSYLESGGAVYGTIFYDNNDRGYYLDPNTSGTALRIAGSIFSDGAFGTNGASSGGTTSRIFAPKGAAYSYTPGGVTGAIKIRLPIRANDTMWSMKVRIYDYNVNKTSEYLLGNYAYSQGAWNYSATYLGGSASIAHTVRFGNEGGYDCVWIGETSTGWSHPVISVMDFMGGYTNGSTGNWQSNWEITIVSSFGTVGASVAPNINFNEVYSYSYRGNSNVAGTGSASYHPSGIYSTGTNWLYGTMYLNNNTIWDANNIYNIGWFRNYNRLGLYNQSYGGHFYQSDSAYWSITGSGTSTFGLQFRSNYDSGVIGYVYGETNGSFGLLNGGSWAVRTTSGGGQLYGGWSVSGSMTIDGWYYTSGASGVYFNNSGTGLWSPVSEGNSYGNVATYGTGRNGWTGYGITSQYVLMGRPGVDVGLHDNASGWIFYSPYASCRMSVGTSTSSSSYRLYVDGQIYATSDIVAYSDRRKKTNIVTIENALDTVGKMRGVFYHKIGEEEKGRQLGVIAQEVNEVLPEAVTYAQDIDEYGVKYGNMVGLLLEAIKEQQKQIEELQNKLDNVLSSR